ncbi:hypothetical protein AcW1_002876 [Taiwanofungus camphoratus]|nr:hypothetical protein AcV5_009457 [Antrodia cinnamomea]KAI0943178.1 hypothetical protein AcV7_002397 [Antrodia cinnamomea]KAI0943803.1 hypothetical protein AcW1_002876 [Antrodia cinnamomea]
MMRSTLFCSILLAFVLSAAAVPVKLRARDVEPGALIKGAVHDEIANFSPGTEGEHLYHSDRNKNILTLE